MNRTIALATQWVGRATVVLALVVLIWTWAELASSNDNSFGGLRFGPNAYVSALASSASLAVSGMFAIGLGLLLERFSNE